ncbi:MAG: glutamate racemase [Clostridia bacterium]|nr:glutamate racemase [Clostridia bacterium]
MADSRAIGIFDSGLGGLTVAKEIMKLLPNENIVYFGDTGRVPYGTRSAATIQKYASEDERFLLSKDVKLIVAACGTVSSVAANTAKDLPVPFIEVISHSVDAAVKNTKNNKIGILATAATIRSGAHKRMIMERLPGAQVVESSGTLLVPLVEEGWTDKEDSVVLQTVQRYVEEMKRVGVDTVIMGCTHFPVLAEAISEVMGQDVFLVNMGVATANAVRRLLEETDALNEGLSHADHKFFVSDRTAAFESTASVLLGEKIDNFIVEQVDINKL